MRYKFQILLLFGIILLFYSYSNHFTNGFYFDDSHTIVNNTFIRNIKNIPLFFKSIETFGTMPDNRGYRPVVTTLNAIDYWLGGGLNSKVFHITYFTYYLLQLIALFFFLQNFFKNYISQTKNRLFFALLIVSFYGLHTANTETLNYIIARSDQFSSLLIILGLLLFQYRFTRRYYLFLIPVIIGLGTKEVTAMFPFLLIILIISMRDKVSFKQIIKYSLPSFIIVFGLFYLMLSSLPAFERIVSTSISYRINYLFTQSIVITHYIANYILPISLSVDYDFVIVKSLLSHKTIFSSLFTGSLLFLGVYSLSKKKLKPIGFGLLWFFLILAPTSSIKPLGQIANDHRVFMPYIGLTIALFWGIYLLYLKLISLYKEKSSLINLTLFLGFLIILGLHSYGIRQRNKVWSSNESLWKDASIKAPNNGRVLMNYGLSLMAKGKYKETLPYFEKSLKLNPYWAYIHINLGILKNAMGKKEEAETYFKNAIRYQSQNPESYLYYARFLSANNRNKEAFEIISKAHQLSPNHSGINRLYKTLSLKQEGVTKEELLELENEIDKAPSVNGYINLSISYYKRSDFNRCIAVCEKILKIEPNNALAYYNICSSYIALKQWEKAAEACQKAIGINPDFQLAKNNLRWAKNKLKK